MTKYIMLLISILFGVYNCFSELILRVPEIMWKYDLYYIIPIRSHIFLVIISVCWIVWGLYIKESCLKQIKIISLVFNLLFIILWVNTMMSM